MHLSTDSDQPSALLGGKTTRSDRGRDTAQPPLTSGFGAVMEQEEKIQCATERSVGGDKGPKSAAIDRILRDHGTRLGANIALLEQRYETLPHPSRFKMLRANPDRLSTAEHAVIGCDDGILSALASQHVALLGKIETLIRQRPDGQRGELILAEIARNHEEMARMLTALVNDDESLRDMVPLSASEAPVPALPKGEAAWENEGGAGQVGTLHG